MKPRLDAALRALRWLGRVHFTMALLVVGALAMTAGTLVESRQGRDSAFHHVYGTRWFDAQTVNGAGSMNSTSLANSAPAAPA